MAVVDGRRGLFGDLQGNAVDDLPFFIGELHRVRTDVPCGGLYIFPGNVHLLRIENRLGPLHTHIHHPQQRGVIARCLQTGIDDEGGDHHDHRGQRVHGIRTVEGTGESNHAHPPYPC